MTPGVVVAAIVCGSLVVLGVAYLVAYLAARGVDPSPVVQLAGTAAGAVTGLGTLVLQLVTRKTATKTERWTGELATAVKAVRPREPAPPVVEDQADDEAMTSWLPPVPPPARQPRHRWPAEWENAGGPRGDGSREPG